MKTWLSYFLSSIIGITAAYLLGTIPQFDLALQYGMSLILNVGTFVLLPMVFVTVFASTASLRKDKALGSVYLVSVAFSLFTSLALCLLAGFAYRFFPFAFPVAENAADFALGGSLAQDLTTELFSKLSSFNPLTNGAFVSLFISPKWLLPTAITAFIFGLAGNPSNDTIKPAYAVLNSFSEIMYRLSKALASLGWVFVLFFSAYFARCFDMANIYGDLKFIIFLSLATLAAAVLVIPFLYWLFSGFKGNPFKSLLRVLSTALLGLFSSNVLLALPGAYHINRRNLGLQKRVVSQTLPFSTFFTRGGTAMVSTLVLCGLLTGSGVVLDAKTIANIALVSAALSLLSSLNLGYESIFVVILTANILGFNLGGREMLVIALLPIINGLGICLDMILSSFNAAVSARGIEAVVKVAYRDTL